MSSTRKVTLKLTTQKDVIEHESSARTFGELKAEMKNVKWDGMRVVVRETKNTLQNPAALLPSTDFILFLVPEKVKSGLGKNNLKKLKNVETASYNELRSHASFLNKVKDAQIAMNGGTEELRKAVQAYYDGQKGAKAEASDDPIMVIEAARTKINDAIDQIIASAKAGSAVDESRYVMKVSVDDLDTEIDEIRKALKL